MREENIENMNFKELRKEVQLLRDELAIFKRKYEDTIYNLDSDNFGKSFTVEQNGMKSQIKITTDAIKTMVSQTDLNSKLDNYSTIEQTAEAISLSVVRIDEATDEKLKNYSTITQTADTIKSTVNAEFVNTLIGDTYVTNAVLSSAIEQSESNITSIVASKYQTKSDASDDYDSLYSEISEVSQTANSFSVKISDLENFNESVFTQTSYGFTLDGEQTTFTGVVYLTNNNGDKRFCFTHDESQGFEQVYLRSYGNDLIPVVIGDSVDNVYLKQWGFGNEIATRNWVLENVGNGGGTVVAVFG